jgi:hypothetical protein
MNKQNKKCNCPPSDSELWLDTNLEWHISTTKAETVNITKRLAKLGLHIQRNPRKWKTKRNI